MNDEEAIAKQRKENEMHNKEQLSSQIEQEAKEGTFSLEEEQLEEVTGAGGCCSAPRTSSPPRTSTQAPTSSLPGTSTQAPTSSLPGTSTQAPTSSPLRTSSLPDISPEDAIAFMRIFGALGSAGPALAADYLKHKGYYQ